MFKLSPSLALSNMERHHPESGQVQASSGHKRNNEPSPNHVTHEICINGNSLDAYVGCPINSDNNVFSSSSPACHSKISRNPITSPVSYPLRS